MISEEILKSSDFEEARWKKNTGATDNSWYSDFAAIHKTFTANTSSGDVN